MKNKYRYIMPWTNLQKERKAQSNQDRLRHLEKENKELKEKIKQLEDKK